MDFETNFDSSQGENGIKQGETLLVKVREAEVIAGGIYSEDLPVLIDQGSNTLKFKLKRGWLRRNLPKGDYFLIVWAYDYETQKGSGWRDGFIIY